MPVGGRVAGKVGYSGNYGNGELCLCAMHVNVDLRFSCSKKTNLFISFPFKVNPMPALMRR